MKTEKEVLERLKIRQKELKETQKRFDKYDNHEDLEMLADLKSAEAELKWVLGK